MSITTTIDGFEATGEIVTFYRGRQYMDDQVRKDAIAEGRMKEEDPDYREMDFVRIKYPGNPYLQPDRPVVMEQIGDEKSDPERWPRQWAAYKSNDGPAVGTPLDVLTALTEGDVRHLDGLSIRNVETLEGMTDGHVISLGMGMRRYRQIARDWRDRQPKAAEALAQREIDELKAQIAILMAERAEKPKRANAA